MIKIKNLIHCFIISKAIFFNASLSAEALINTTIISNNNPEIKDVFEREVPTGEVRQVNVVSFWENEITGELYPEFRNDQGELLPHLNSEIIQVTETKTFGVVNVYPGETEIIELPSISDLLGIPWLMSASTFDENSGEIDPENFSLISMPEGTSLIEASMFGLRSGSEYTASITQINDLSMLPTSFLNTNVTWDLSNFSETTGTFFLAEVQMPFEEITSATDIIHQPVHEPNTILSVLMISSLSLGFKLKKH